MVAFGDECPPETSDKRPALSRRGLTQERLGTDSGVDRAYVGGIERQTENPSIDVLDKLASTLEIEVSALLITPPTKEMPANLKVGRKPGR